MNLFQLLFGESFQLLFDFEGRINRAKYWLSFLIYIGSLIVLYILVVIVAALIGIPDLATIFIVVALVPVVISCTAVGIKRLHDRNKSGWWLLVFYLLPSLLSNIGRFIGFEVVFQLAGSVFSVWALIKLGFLRGTRGRNRFGSDPLAVGSMRVRK